MAHNERSFHGPALVITAVGEPSLVGLVGLIDRGGHAVELSYGVAPDRRGHGYARDAARLAAGWLLDERLASLVELRIDPANAASLRVAAAAGFTKAEAATGAAGDDLHFVLRGR
jgi:RimJ/RimL family protein N-acetyltransferase